MRAGSEYPPFNVRAEVLYLCLFHRTLINLLPVACCTVGVLPALPLRGPHQGSVQKIMPGVSLQQCCCYLGGALSLHPFCHFRGRTVCTGCSCGSGDLLQGRVHPTSDGSISALRFQNQKGSGLAE